MKHTEIYTKSDFNYYIYTHIYTQCTRTCRIKLELEMLDIQYQYQ